MYTAMGGEHWATNAAYAGDDPYYAQNWTGGNNFWNVIDPVLDTSFAADPCQEKTTSEGIIPDWFGVHCEDPCYEPIDGFDCRFGRITSIHLPANNLTGTIPPGLFDALVNLTIIDFSHNDISGTIPTEVGKLRNINMFLLGNNKLSGTIPTEIYTMGSHVGPDEEACALEDLVNADGTPLVIPEGGLNWTVEEYAAFNGTCATHAVHTMGLTQFDVSANKLWGMLPTTFGDLVNLQAIDVSRNSELGKEGYNRNGVPAGNPGDTWTTDDLYHQQFYGYNYMIPTEMGYLKKLQVLKMDNSRFMQWMPTEIGNMRSLRFWDVKGSTENFDDGETNAVSGTIPTQFGRLKNLMTFNMANNTISGTIPVDLANITTLERFEVPDNKLSGSIPNFFAGMTNSLETWDTFNNKLEGDLPSSIGELKNLEYLYVQNEHTDPLRNYFCKERISMSANGKKANLAMMASEYISFAMPGTCVEPLDIHGTFDPLSGDV